MAYCTRFPCSDNFASFNVFKGDRFKVTNPANNLKVFAASVLLCLDNGGLSAQETATTSNQPRKLWELITYPRGQ